MEIHQPMRNNHATAAAAAAATATVRRGIDQAVTPAMMTTGRCCVAVAQAQGSAALLRSAIYSLNDYCWGLIN